MMIYRLKNRPLFNKKNRVKLKNLKQQKQQKHVPCLLSHDRAHERNSMDQQKPKTDRHGSNAPGPAGQ